MFLLKNTLTSTMHYLLSFFRVPKILKYLFRVCLLVSGYTCFGPILQVHVQHHIHLWTEAPLPQADGGKCFVSSLLKLTCTDLWNISQQNTVLCFGTWVSFFLQTFIFPLNTVANFNTTWDEELLSQTYLL